MTETPDERAVEALLLGNLIQWAGDEADLADCREVASALARAVSAAGYLSPEQVAERTRQAVDDALAEVVTIDPEDREAVGRLLRTYWAKSGGISASDIAEAMRAYQRGEPRPERPASSVDAMQDALREMREARARGGEQQ